VKPEKNLDMIYGFTYSSQGNLIGIVSLENYNERFFMAGAKKIREK